MRSTYKLLQLALAVFGVIMLLVYPLALIWPAGWSYNCEVGRAGLEPATNGL